MEIIRADHSGFCFGVRKAVDTAYQLAENPDAHPLFTHGQLIHNAAVTDDLARKGVRILEDLSEAGPDATVLVRAHGEPESFYEDAAARGIRLVDTTCPFVSRIHTIVKQAYETGRRILIIGDRAHPEVIGINGWCGNSAWIAATPDEADDYPWTEAFVVCQTTLKKETLDAVTARLAEKGVHMEVHNTICSATSQRQKSAAELAARVDAMVVIGGRNSSNTRKLYEICKNICKNTFFIESISDLPLKDLENCNKIGLAAGASTPERIIKEVFTSMSDNITKETESVESEGTVETMADFMDEIDASTKLPHNGEVVTGKVDQVNDDEVIVNLGFKKDGILPKNEVTLEEGQTLKDLFHVDDEIEAKVISTDDNAGGILLSKKKLEVNKVWGEIAKAAEDKSNIEVKVHKIVKGGVLASYKGESGFIPLSQLSNRYVETADEFMDQVLTVKVTRVDTRKNRAVFSHKMVLAEERQKRLDEIWETLNVGDIVEGTVMRFTDYGAFVDLGGIDGLLHISEISWGKLKHPSEALEIGQKIHVKILSMNREKGKISLGLKQTIPEPWSVIDEKYHVDDIVTGKIVQLKEYGAFVELEPGLDGLVHISEVANKHVNDINEELKVGQIVNTKILDIDTERKRISLSIKHAPQPEPAEDAEEETPADAAAPAEAEAPAEEAAPEAPAAEAPAEEVPAAEAPAAEEAPAEEPAKDEE